MQALLNNMSNEIFTNKLVAIIRLVQKLKTCFTITAEVLNQ